MSGDALPLAAVVIRYDPADRVGVLQLEDGEHVRFGATACSGFDPALGMQVYIAEFVPHPLGGRKAANVRDVPLGDRAFARARQDLHDARTAEALRPLNAAEAHLPDMPPPDGSRPAIADVVQFLSANERALLYGLCEDADRNDLLEVSTDGSVTPWEFYDPSFRTFGLDGGGNVFGLHYYPPVVERSGRLPVVFWDHEQLRFAFQAESLSTWISCLAHVHGMPDLARRYGLQAQDPGTDRIREVDDLPLDWPLPTAPDLETVWLTAEQQRERDLVSKLVSAATLDEVVAALAALDEIYQRLGWVHHLRVLRHQRVEWFSEQRRLALPKPLSPERAR